VPSGLRDIADLGTEAVVVGARDHAEIWSPARWDALSQEMASPESLAQHLAGLGI
jgi:DNA-binding transcriptional regulator/RsmH inhibitor MraZ